MNKYELALIVNAKIEDDARAAVVEDVGARLSGHASRFICTGICISEFRAMREFGFPVMLMMGTFRYCSDATRRSSSSVFPELDIIRKISSSVIMPKSPCMASSGLMKNDGVPVLASVAAIFAPTCPDFPTPVTMRCPLQWNIISTALSNSSSNCGMRSSNACASSLMHFTAYSLTFSMTVYE